MRNAKRVDLTGITDVREAAVAAGIAYDVELQPMYLGEQGLPRVDTGHKAVVRTDTGTAIGVVGARYVPVQNSAFLAPLQPLLDQNALVLKEAYEYDGGRVTVIRARLPQPLVLPAVGLGQYTHHGYNGQDVLFRDILWTNSYDGSRQVSLIDSIEREWCTNKATHILGMSSWGFRHTRQAIVEVEQVTGALQASVLRFDKVAENARLLSATPFNETQMAYVANALYPLPTEPDANPVRSMKAQSALVAEFRNTQRGAFGLTAWDAVSALTAFATHERTTRANGRDEDLARLKSIFVGGNVLVAQGVREVAHAAGLTIDVDFQVVGAAA